MKLKLTLLIIFSLTTHLFSAIGVGKSTEGPLPVNLTYFTAEFQDGFVVLQWRTASETNNYGFEVERITGKMNEEEGKGDWRSIAFLSGGGNSSIPKNYSYIDKNLQHNIYSYRLKQIDFDGRFHFSELVEIELKFPSEFLLYQNYPNPFSKGNPVTNIEYFIPYNDFSKQANEISSNDVLVVLKVFNILGEEMALLVNGKKPSGSHRVQFSAGNLPAGVYIYSLNAGDITLNKKFVLLK